MWRDLVSRAGVLVEGLDVWLRIWKKREDPGAEEVFICLLQCLNTC